MFKLIRREWNKVQLFTKKSDDGLWIMGASPGVLQNIISLLSCHEMAVGSRQ